MSTRRFPPQQLLDPLPPQDHQNLSTALAITLAMVRGDRVGARKLAAEHGQILDLIESMAAVAMMLGMPLAQSHNDTLEQLLSDMLRDLTEQGPAS